MSLGNSWSLGNWVIRELGNWGIGNWGIGELVDGEMGYGERLQ